MRRWVALLGLVAGAVALGASSCNTERLLSVSVDDERAGDIPNFTQEIGKARTGDFGRVRVADSPGPSAPGKWIQLTQANHAPPTELVGFFTAVRGPGRYLFTCQLFVPQGNAAFVGLNETSGGLDPGSFIMLSFLSGGSVSAISGSGSKQPSIGQFPHDQAFSVSVSLDVGATTTTATVTLLGVAHGSKTFTLTDLDAANAKSFASVELFTDTANAGSTFFGKSLSVVRTGP